MEPRLTITAALELRSGSPTVLSQNHSSELIEVAREGCVEGVIFFTLFLGVSPKFHKILFEKFSKKIMSPRFHTSTDTFEILFSNFYKFPVLYG